jgi:hypothetical protein
MSHVFISYVRADADKVDQLALDLYRHGIDTWTDRDLRPGLRWKFTIRQAILQGAAFLACFSPEVAALLGVRVAVEGGGMTTRWTVVRRMGRATSRFDDGRWSW